MNKPWIPEHVDEHNQEAFLGNLAAKVGRFRRELEDLQVDWNLWLQTEANDLRSQLNAAAAEKMADRPRNKAATR